MSLKKFVIASGLLFYIFAGSASAHEGHNDAFSEGASGEPKAVEVDDQGVRALGLVFGSPKFEATNELLKATGEVQAAEQNAFDVNPPVPGAVRAVYVKLGDKVRKGQPLGLIHSVEVAQTITNLLSERGKLQAEKDRVQMQYSGDITLQRKELQLSEQEYQRQQTLFNEKIAAKKTLQQAQNEFEKSNVKLDTLENRKQQELRLLDKQIALATKTVRGQLKIMGMSEQSVTAAIASGNVTADLPILSPVSGVVTFRDLTLGERVDPSTRIFSIVNPDPIWITVDIFQEQLPEVALGQTVQIKTPSHQSLTGRISSIGSVVDPVKKAVHVRVEAPNSSGILKPGMFVTAEILLPRLSNSALFVPNEAIIESDGKHFIYKREKDHFVPAAIEVGESINGKFPVTSGVSIEDTIVMAGARQLMAQSMLKGHADEHEGAGHDEHDAHDEHESSVKPQSKPEVSMLMTFVGGLATALVAVAIFGALRKKSVDPRQTKEAPRTKEHV